MWILSQWPSVKIAEAARAPQSVAIGTAVEGPASDEVLKREGVSWSEQAYQKITDLPNYKRLHGNDKNNHDMYYLSFVLSYFIVINQKIKNYHPFTNAVNR